MKLRLLDYVFVLIQSILFVIYFLDVEIIKIAMDTNVFWLILCGFLITIGILIVVISVMQLNKNLSPFPSPRKSSQLINNGLYAYFRHPIYTGLLCMSFGYAMLVFSIFKIIIVVVLMILFYFKSIYEEKKLSILFVNYKEYQKTTGRFFPKLNLF